mgnify:CR=1 FL=1
MISEKYTLSSAPFSSSQLANLHTEITQKNTTSWHILMGNITQNEDNQAYRKEIKNTLKLMFKESREDEAMYILEEEDYKIIFSKIVSTLQNFFEEDVEFKAILANYYRDARFDLSDTEKVIFYAKQAAEQNNSLGMATLAYQYFFGSASKKIEQDKEKGFDFADKAMLINPINGAFCKAFLLFQDKNYEVTESIINELISNPKVENSDIASAIYTLKADLALIKKNDTEAIEFLQKACQLDQSAHSYYLLGRYHLYGNATTPPNLEKGLEYLQKSLEKGASYAGINLGTYLLHSEQQKKNEQKNEQNIKKAQFVLEKAATYNNPSASYELARMYIFTEHFDITYKQKAISILEKIKEKYYPSYVELAYQFLLGKNTEKDLQKALDYLKEGIEKGYGYAAFYLGREYQNGVFNENSEDNSPDYQNALFWYEKGAELNCMEAIEIAGKYYRLGIGVEPNAEKTLNYIQKGIENFNSDFSKIELAICYETGFGVEQDYQKAFQNYENIAQNNHYYGLYKMGLYYRDGILPETLIEEKPDFEKAFEYFTKSANQNYPSAHYELSKATFYGSGTEKNIEKGIEMFHQDIENKIFDAAVDLGLYYENPEEGNNPEKAFEYMKKATEQGQIPYSMYKMGLYYQNDFGINENPENIEEAKKYYQLAANNNYPYANIPLGNMELWQETKESKEENAFDLYTKAAEFGYYNYGLGMCYKYGIGTVRDAKKAFQSFKNGQEQNDILAIYHLALAHLEGDGTAKNATQAFQFFESIAPYHSPSKYQIAKLFLQGKGTDKNVLTGIKCLEEVAQEENAPAQYELGNLYLTGNGVEENTETAVEWFKKAAQNGHKEAARIINPAKNRRN